MQVTLSKSLGLTGAFPIRSHTLKSGTYLLVRVPNPFWKDSADWFVLVDSDTGMSAGMWMDEDFQRFAGFKLAGIEDN